MSEQAAVNIGAQMRQRERGRDRDHGMSGDAASREASGDNFMLTPIHVYVMQNMFPPLFGVVALKYQANPNRLFLEKPATVCCFVLAICFYWLLMAVIKNMRTTAVEGEWFDRADRPALALGLLAAISVLAMLLPHPVSVVPLTVWMVLTIVFAWPEICLAYGSLKGIINKIADWINGTIRAEGEV